jgi:protein TonB
MKYNALLFCPDEKTARVVTQVLTDLEFRVEPCNEPFAAVKKLMAEHFDAIVVDCDSEQNGALLFKSAHNSGSNQSSLAVAVVEGQAGVAKAFRIGANLVLTKPINVEQSKGTLRVARGLLRKTEAGKPSSPAVSSAQSTASMKSTSAPFLPAQPAPSPIPAVSASVFEVEADPTPEPEPTEAALLESMPAPVPPPTPAKDYPWQPISKPAARPMATALRRAAEATGRSQPDAPAANKNFSAPPVVPHPPTSLSHTIGMASGQAAAAAPAKIAPKAHADTETPQLDAPAFASLGADPTQKASGGSNKTIMIAAAAVIAAAAIGYIGWTKMQSSSTPAAQNVTPPAHVSQAPAQPPVSEEVAQSASSSRDSESATKLSQPANAQSVEQGPDITLSTKAQRPAADRFTSDSVTADRPPADRPSPAKKSSSTDASNTVPHTPSPAKSAPMVVKNEASSPVPPSPFQTDSAQPPSAVSLSASSNTNDAAISGIMSTVAVSTPQQAPQKLKISQGVSQGLLIKSVDPVYPALARQMRLQGSVELLANIGTDGSITSVKLLSGDSILSQAAISAVKQWKYKPYYLGDQAVAIQTQITVKFKLP